MFYLTHQYWFPAYIKVGKNGVVLMEESETEKTYVEIVDGVQFDSGLKSPHLITDKDKNNCVLKNPLILLVDSKVSTVRKIQSVLEYAIKNKRAILIIGDVDVSFICTEIPFPTVK